MEFAITDVASSDLDEILALNEAEVPHVGRVDIARLHWFAANAACFRVARAGDRLAGFLIGLRPGTAYDSLNYRWFCDRYDDFAYVDRIAVAVHARRQGLASLLYEDLAAKLPAAVKIMTCEVNLRPPNEQSMRYHTQQGFHEVGRLTTAGDSKEVAMLLKDL